MWPRTAQGFWCRFGMHFGHWDMPSQYREIGIDRRFTVAKKPFGEAHGPESAAASTSLEARLRGNQCMAEPSQQLERCFLALERRGVEELLI